MRWLPIRWRLTLFHAITMAVIVVLLIISLFAVLGVVQEDRLEDRVGDCAWIGESALRNTGTLDPGYLSSLGCGGTTLAALDDQGRILSQFGYAGEPGTVYPGEVWRAALERGQPVQERRDPALTQSGIRFAHAIPVSIDDPPVRVIVSSMRYESLGDDDIFLVPVIIAGVALVALVVIVVASYLLARSSLAPVTAITESAREITASDLSRRLPVANPRDELGRLSQTINDLLARLEAAFAERERALAEQRRFAADASHELRTPLTSILGYARMLRQWGLDNPATAQEGVAALEQEAERMHRLVEALLHLARGDEDPMLNPGEHDLREVVRDAEVAARAFAAHAVDLSVDLPETPVVAMVDREMVVQVLEILLDNAVKYAGSETPITVSLRPEGDRAVIQVADRGPGIAPDHLPYLFDRFYRVETSRTAGGSGLGLAIAKQIVEQHGGAIAVESTEGEGTTFTMTLPRLDDAPRSVGTPAVSSTSP